MKTEAQTTAERVTYMLAGQRSARAFVANIMAESAFGEVRTLLFRHSYVEERAVIDLLTDVDASTAFKLEAKRACGFRGA